MSTSKWGKGQQRGAWTSAIRETLFPRMPLLLKPPGTTHQVLLVGTIPRRRRDASRRREARQAGGAIQIGGAGARCRDGPRRAIIILSRSGKALTMLRSSGFPWAVIGRRINLRMTTTRDRRHGVTSLAAGAPRGRPAAGGQAPGPRRAGARINGKRPQKVKVCRLANDVKYICVRREVRMCTP